MQNLTVGILGGMGPRATVEFEQRFVAQFQAIDQDIPTIISINDGSIPDRTLFLLGKGASPVPKLLANARSLVALGATQLCLPCNTAHADKILGSMLAQEHFPIIDMPAASLSQAKEQGAKNVLILGTLGTKQSRVFDNRAHNISCKYPTAKEQHLVNRLIATIKQGSPVQPLHVARLRHCINTSGCDIAILACTELSLLHDKLEGLPIIDSLDALAQETKNQHQPKEITL